MVYARGWGWSGRCSRARGVARTGGCYLRRRNSDRRRRRTSIWEALREELVQRHLSRVGSTEAGGSSEVT